MDSDEEILQQADCYVEGLTPLPFHEINSVTYPWALELARSYQTINDELQVYNQNQINIMNADQEWLPPRDAVGDAKLVYYAYAVLSCLAQNDHIILLLLLYKDILLTPLHDDV